MLGIIGAAACTASVIYYLTTILTCHQIIRRLDSYNNNQRQNIGNETKSQCVLPFIGGLYYAILSLRYSILIAESSLMLVNIIAMILYVSYAFIFFDNFKDQVQMITRYLTFGSSIISILLAYSFIENTEKVAFRYGMIVFVMNIVQTVAPLIEIQEIIKRRDASQIPLTIVLIGAIASFLWTLQGYDINNDFVIMENSLCLSLYLVQIYLIYRYPSNKKMQAEARN